MMALRISPKLYLPKSGRVLAKQIASRSIALHTRLVRVQLRLLPFGAVDPLLRSAFYPLPIGQAPLCCPNIARRFASKTATLPARVAPALPASLDALGLKYMQENELRQLFEGFDLNNDNSIDRAGAQGILRQAGAKDTSPEAAENLVDSLGTSSSGRITWEEFRAAVDRAAEPVDKRIYPVSFSLGLHFIGLGVQQPSLPLLARELGLSHSDLGMVTAAGALTRISFNVPMALLAESYGRRPLLVVGPALGAAFMTCMGLSTSFFGLAASSAALGLGGTAVMTGAGLYLNDIATPKNRARTTAPLMLTAIFGFSVGPAAGGFLAQSYGLQSPFFVCAGGMALASLSAALTLPETQRAIPNSGKEQKSTLQQWYHLMRRPALQGIISNVFMSGFAQGAAPVSTVLFASEILGMSPSNIGLMFTAQVLGMGICVQPATSISDKLAKEDKRLHVMLPGMATGALALAMQSCCSIMETFIACGVLVSIGNAFVMPNVSAFIMDNTYPEERAQALAMQRMSQDVGLLMGASCMGFVATHMGVPFAMQATAALQACAAVFCGVRGRTINPKPARTHY